ncbi:hypothetical protein [Xanthomonas campestris]|uniref:hypothetical protein n=1 Tax=Xanthomonas campestris TaxID=339 RepID=UPI00355636FD
MKTIPAGAKFFSVFAVYSLVQIFFFGIPDNWFRWLLFIVVVVGPGLALGMQSMSRPWTWFGEEE